MRPVACVAIVLASLVSACAPSPSRSSAEPTARPPADEPSPAVPPVEAAPAPLSPEVEACLSGNARSLAAGRGIYEVVRVRGALGEFVHLAIADPADRAASVTPVLLLVGADGQCTSLLDHEGVFYAVEDAAPADVEPRLVDAFERWRTAWAQGATP